MEIQFKWKLVIEQREKNKIIYRVRKTLFLYIFHSVPFDSAMPFPQPPSFFKAGGAEMQAEALTGAVHIAHGSGVLSEASGCTRNVQCRRKVQLCEDGCILVKVDLAFAFFFF